MSLSEIQTCAARAWLPRFALSGLLCPSVRKFQSVERVLNLFRYRLLPSRVGTLENFTESLVKFGLLNFFSIGQRATKPLVDFGTDVRVSVGHIFTDIHALQPSLYSPEKNRYDNTKYSRDTKDHECAQENASIQYRVGFEVLSGWVRVDLVWPGAQYEFHEYSINVCGGNVGGQHRSDWKQNCEHEDNYQYSPEANPTRIVPTIRVRHFFRPSLQQIPKASG
jgi:hypothetical protein